MLVGSIQKGIALDGYIENGMVEVHSIKSRHEELVAEMLRRGYDHQSPLPEFINFHGGMVDPERSLADLKSRCKLCKI